MSRADRKREDEAAREGKGARKQELQNRSKGVDIGPLIKNCIAANLLRRHVATGTDDCAVSSQRLIFGRSVRIGLLDGRALHGRS